MVDYTVKSYNKSYENLYETLVNSANKYPTKVAIIDDNGEVTYKELQEKVDELSSYLVDVLKCKEQEQIGFLMVNSIRMVIAFYATVKIGCIAVMINTKFRENEILDLLKEVEVNVIFSDECWTEKLAKSIQELQIHFLLTESTVININNKESSDSLVKNSENTAVIMHTSGTTGEPKGIMITHRNILENAYGYEEIQGLDAKAITVLSVSLFHILGLSCVTAYFIYLGGTIILSKFYNARNVLEQITKYKATHFHSVPTIYLQMIKEYNLKKDCLDSLEICICGGAPISEKKVDEFCEIAVNASFRLAYGMTETAGAGALSCEHREPLKAMPNVFIDTVKGEIIFCGPVVAKGRWKEKSLEEDIVNSGDIGYLDKEKHVFVMDRIKDIINRGGEKIFPSMIEKVLLEYDGILKAAVVGIPHEEYGELPIAVIVPEKNKVLDEKEIEAFLSTRIAKYKMPKKIEIWKELPVTQNGKVKKAELKQKFENVRD